MDKYTATELAYKNGYEKGYEAGYADCLAEMIKTNADRIRGMSDRELAEEIVRIAFDIYNCNEGQVDLVEALHCKAMCDNNCVECVAGWLNATVEV